MAQGACYGLNDGLGTMLPMTDTRHNSLIVYQTIVSRSRKLMLDLSLLWWVVILDLLGLVGGKSMLTIFDDIK
jgi:hypothetical protein